MSIADTLKNYYEVLSKRYGPQKWWPADTPFEVMLGAILTQNTSWANVTRALDNLKEAGLLSPQKLYEIDSEQLAQLIKPAGYFNIKAKRLKNLLDWLFQNYQGSVQQMLADDLVRLRPSLLTVSGIGPETCDSILLYAAGKPTFVVDTYTYRVLVRHNLIWEDATYDDIKALFEDNLPEDVALYNEYHALLVRVGKEYCRPEPRHKGCPLEPFLP
ncbi:MAG: endonuclease [Planctomycetes bacterium DG_23]|nr:MAG: endonuclease [Planctomycetes bacterium DG_23]